MSEGSPLAALQRREAVNVVPALLIQPRVDQQHIYHDPGAPEPGTDFDKFVAAYRAAGGSLDVAMYDAPQYFTVQRAFKQSCVHSMPSREWSHSSKTYS